MNFIQLHPRVSVGNHAHRYAMQIHILRNLFEVSTNDERVVRATESILEVCFEGSSTGMVVWLTWPVLIAGMHSTSYEQRASVLALLQSFKTQACWDVESAEAILKEYWRRYDLGHNTLSWMDVMRVGIDLLLKCFSKIFLGYEFGRLVGLKFLLERIVIEEICVRKKEFVYFYSLKYVMTRNFRR